MPIPSPNDISTAKIEIPLNPAQRDILMSHVIHTYVELSDCAPTIRSAEYTRRSIGNQTLLATRLRLQDGLVDGFVKATTQQMYHRSGLSFSAIRHDYDIFWRQVNPYDGSALSNEDIADKLFSLAGKGFPSRSHGQELTDALLFELLTQDVPGNKLRSSREFKVEQIDDEGLFAQELGRLVKEVTEHRNSMNKKPIDEASISSQGVMRVIQLTANYHNAQKLQSLETGISSQIEIAEGVKVTKTYEFSIQNPLNNRAHPYANITFTGHPMDIAPYHPRFRGKDGYQIHTKDYVYQLLAGLSFLQSYIEAENSFLALPPITRH